MFDPFDFETTIEWLLEPSNPSVRFWALQKLKNKSINDSEVLDSRKKINDIEIVKSILSNLEGNSYWVNK